MESEQSFFGKSQDTYSLVEMEKNYGLKNTDYGFFKKFRCSGSVKVFEIKVFSQKIYLVDALFHDNDCRVEVTIGEKKSESRVNLKMAEFILSYSDNISLSLAEVLLGVKILL